VGIRELRKDIFCDINLLSSAEISRERRNSWSLPTEKFLFDFCAIFFLPAQFSFKMETIKLII